MSIRAFSSKTWKHDNVHSPIEEKKGTNGQRPSLKIISTKQYQDSNSDIWLNYPAKPPQTPFKRMANLGVFFIYFRLFVQI